MSPTKESTTTTRRRAAVGSGDNNNDNNESTAELELSRWTLEADDDDETEPLTTTTITTTDSTSEAGDEESNNLARRRRSTSKENAPITVKLTDYIESEQEEEYLIWQKGISNAMEDVAGQENVGCILLKETLSDKGGLIRYMVLFRFRNRESASLWHKSATRREWLQKLADSNFHHPNHPQHFSSTDSSYHPIPIFDVTEPIPDDVSFTSSQQQSSTLRPQRWRTMILVWIQVYVLVEFYGMLLPIVFGDPVWGSIDFHLQLIISTAMTTLTIELVTMQIFVKFARCVKFLS